LTPEQIVDRLNAVTPLTRALVGGLGFLVLIIRELREAPEGYEDEYGFHIVLSGATG
jgi:hypothetical protein